MFFNYFPKEKNKLNSVLITLSLVAADLILLMQEFEKLEAGNFYHIYNRGINGENIFLDAFDYGRFVFKIKKYLLDVLDIYAYCLMCNHFHSLVEVKENIVLPKTGGNGFVTITGTKQLGHMLNSYAQSFNHTHERTGGLFEKPFKRKYVESRDSLTSVITYIHTNPTHHEFCEDFREWPYSSYHDLIKGNSSVVNVEAVINLFGGMQNFISAHDNRVEDMGKEKWMIE